MGVRSTEIAVCKEFWGTLGNQQEAWVWLVGLWCSADGDL